MYYFYNNFKRLGVLLNVKALAKYVPSPRIDS
jgi:hypothetical protein